MVSFASAQDGFELRWPWHKTRFHMLYVFAISLFSQTLFATYLSWTKLFPKNVKKSGLGPVLTAPEPATLDINLQCVSVGGNRRGR